MKVRALIQPKVSSSAPTEEEGGLELGRIIEVLRRRLLLIAGVTALMAGAGVYKAKTDTPVYISGFEILTEPVTAEAKVLSSVPQTASSQENTEQTATLDDTKIKVLRSPALLLPLVEQLEAKYPDLDYGKISSSLTIQTSETNVLGVTFQSENAQLVKDLLKLLSEAYLSYSLEDRQKDIRQGIVFVEGQLPNLEARVSAKQEELQRFRQRYNVVDPALQAEQLSQQVGEFTKAQLDTATELNEARLLYESLRAELGGQPPETASASALNSNSRYQRLLDKLLEIDTQIAQDSALYLNGSPEMGVLQLQRNNLIPLLQREGVRSGREMVSQIQELELRNQSLLQAINTVNQRIKQLSVITREHTDIQRELQIATDNLNQFLTKREALRIDASQRQVPWQLLTPPNEPFPVSASVKRNLVLGTILGLLLGVGAALLADRLGGILRTASEVKEITKLPLLGIIPLQEQPEQDETFLQQHLSWLQLASAKLSNSRSSKFVLSPFEEAFRSLYTNILLIDPDTPIHSLVVSSAVPNSGKTTIAINLAQAAAAMGRRVLLIDTDLRQPDLHKELKLPNYRGLSDVVSGHSALLDAVEPIEHEPNLWVLTAGMPPPDPLRLLSSKTMEQLMSKAADEFDLVIYDTPPMLGFADVRLLSAKTDGLLLVVRLDQIKRSLLQQTIEDLRGSGATALGVVANGSKDEITPYTHFRLDESKTPTV